MLQTGHARLRGGRWWRARPTRLEGLNAHGGGRDAFDPRALCGRMGSPCPGACQAPAGRLGPPHLRGTSAAAWYLPRNGPPAAPARADWQSALAGGLAPVAPCQAGCYGSARGLSSPTHHGGAPQQGGWPRSGWSRHPTCRRSRAPLCTSNSPRPVGEEPGGGGGKERGGEPARRERDNSVEAVPARCLRHGR